MSISQSGAQAAALAQLQSLFPIPSGLLPDEVASIQAAQTKLAQAVATQSQYVKDNAIVQTGISVTVDGKTGSTTGAGTLS